MTPEMFVELFRDSEPAVRSAAARILGEMRSSVASNASQAF